MVERTQENAGQFTGKFSARPENHENVALQTTTLGTVDHLTGIKRNLITVYKVALTRRIAAVKLSPIMSLRARHDN